MTCPRCGAEGKVSLQPCGRCGFFLQGAGAFSNAVEASLASGTSHPREQPPEHTPDAGHLVLFPGELLAGARYCLKELVELQRWRQDTYEATWVAQDTRRAGAMVSIREVGVPDAGSLKTQSSFLHALSVFEAMSRHLPVPALVDVFREAGQFFFVFDVPKGESLRLRMQRTGQTLPQREVMTCCLNILAILQQLSTWQPPVVHGMIRPEHIHIPAGRESFYTLTHFSVILAADPFLLASGVDRASLSRYTSPECARGTIDGRADLYALVATAYYALTASPPPSANRALLKASHLNAHIAEPFHAMLSKGLHADASQRYQHPEELRQDLLAVAAAYDGSGSSQARTTVPLLAGGAGQLPAPLASTVSAATPQYQLGASALHEREGAESLDVRTLLLPNVEALPPMKNGSDQWIAALWWLAGIVGVLLVLVLLSGGTV